MSNVNFDDFAHLHDIDAARQAGMVGLSSSHPSVCKFGGSADVPERRGRRVARSVKQAFSLCNLTFTPEALSLSAY
jgi:hypothetical protein